ncbi:MAG: ATP-dependent RecD-like DNA helicase, partial [Deltaproteobacteria bacterium]|nr:ATP-dependent RecD-like DNA helicase [Deltaproteobacteria bacterium]
MAERRDGGNTAEGTVERVVFRNRDNGYTVLRLAVDGAPLLATVVGNFQHIDAGERVRFSGEWIVDPKHGRQFKAETCLPLAPATLKGIEKFLGSGLIPGIGPVMAERIVKRFGLETLELIEHDSKRLAEVEGIGPKRARSIRKGMIAKRAVKEVMVFLESAGVSPTFAHRIFKRYGNDAIRRVSDNPYRLAADVHGIGFHSADRIAAHLGVPDDSPHRAEAGLLHSLEELASGGHIFARQGDLLPRAQTLLEVEQVDLERALDRLTLMGGIWRQGQGDDAAVYLPRLHRAEGEAATRLAGLLRTRSKKLPIDPDEAAKRAEKLSGIELAPGQRQVFQALRS